jgi:hypothetical protein
MSSLQNPCILRLRKFARAEKETQIVENWQSIDFVSGLV